MADEPPSLGALHAAVPNEVDGRPHLEHAQMNEGSGGDQRRELAHLD
jgi:hypothetical protein